MASLLLPVIYLAFISLGLPDALLGSAWPSMYTELGASLSWAGIVSMIISVGTIVSALCSERLNLRLGTGGVTFLSVLLTAGGAAGLLASAPVSGSYACGPCPTAWARAASTRRSTTMSPCIMKAAT